MGEEKPCPSGQPEGHGGGERFTKDAEGSSRHRKHEHGGGVAGSPAAHRGCYVSHRAWVRRFVANPDGAAPDGAALLKLTAAGGFPERGDGRGLVRSDDVRGRRVRGAVPGGLSLGRSGGTPVVRGWRGEKSQRRCNLGVGRASAAEAARKHPITDLLASKLPEAVRGPAGWVPSPTSRPQRVRSASADDPIGPWPPSRGPLLFRVGRPHAK